MRVAGGGQQPTSARGDGEDGADSDGEGVTGPSGRRERMEGVERDGVVVEEGASSEEDEGVWAFSEEEDAEGEEREAAAAAAASHAGEHTWPVAWRTVLMHFVGY